MGWRQSQRYFKTEDQWSDIPPGVVNISPAWFQQAHNTAEFDVDVSASLKHSAHDGCRDWVLECGEANGLLSAITRVVHPELYEAGRQAYIAMQGHPGVRDSVRQWSSVYSAISAMANRMTPLHRDVGSLAEGYDLLVTIGGDVWTKMLWPSLGVELAYRTGTAVFFSGYSIPHEVPESHAERFCLAYYMKDDVHERFGVKGASWMEYGIYQ